MLEMRLGLLVPKFTLLDQHGIALTQAQCKVSGPLCFSDTLIARISALQVAEKQVFQQPAKDGKRFLTRILPAGHRA
jgi:hypothetical protein